MYKLNNITFLSLGITPGRIKGEGIAVKGCFDLPKRIGTTFQDWSDSDSVEPYVEADEIFLGGRTILFAGIIQGTKTEIETKLFDLKTLINSFESVVPFESPYGVFCVYLRNIKIKSYLNGATFIIEMREPELGASCGVVVNPPTTYSSDVYSESAVKNNCDSGYYGTSVELSSTLGQFTSTLSQEAANQLAINWVRENKQNYANLNGVCNLNPVIYWNEKIIGELQKDNCNEGAAGSIVSYTVLAFKYSSMISQADANAKAQAEMDANLTQAYANEQGYCTILPSFKLISEEAFSGGIGVAPPWGTIQYFEVGEAIVPGTVYVLMMFGVQFSYTSSITDSPESIVNWFVTWINLATVEDWSVMNQQPDPFPIPPVASLSGYNKLKLYSVYVPLLQGATVWVE